MTFKILSIIALAALALACVRAKNSSSSSNDTSSSSVNVSGDVIKVVSPNEFKTAYEAEDAALLLDVRTPEEYAEGHLKGAKLLDWKNPDSFKEGAKTLDATKTIYVYCRSGRRSNAAAQFLASQGFKVIDMDGGILSWTSEGLEVVKE